MSFLHEQKIRHNDIKPTNILLHERRILICDFGIAKDWAGRDEGTTSGTIQGMTERYCAPEIKFATDRNETSDVFSLGCVFIEMLTVLSGASIDDLNQFLTNGRRDREHNSGLVTFWSSLDQLVPWLHQLRLSKEWGLVTSLVAQMVCDIRSYNFERIGSRSMPTGYETWCLCVHIDIRGAWGH